MKTTRDDNKIGNFELVNTNLIYTSIIFLTFYVNVSNYIELPSLVVWFLTIY